MQTGSVDRRGIILAGGSGSRLDPMTREVSKQLLPVFDKPLIYYPLSTLMLAGLREILLICTPRDVAAFQRLLGDGSQLGVALAYAVQPQPRGLAEAFLLGKQFIGGRQVALILGDNIFYGHGLAEKLQQVSLRCDGATVFSYPVKDPERYGVVSFDQQGRPTAIVEKPLRPASHQAVTGLYFYDNQVVDIAAGLQPSPRGELEISDVNRVYLAQQQLHVEALGRGYAWLDTGTETSLLQAANFVQTVQARQGLRIACIEEVAYRMGYITADQVEALAAPLHNPYGRYLLEVIDRRPSDDR